MESNSPERLLEEYLEQIKEELQGIPSFSRQEFIKEIRSHLEEEWNRVEGDTNVDMQNILNSFGEPEEIAQEYREKFPETSRSASASYPPTWLVIALTAFIWPVGIILAWLSPTWSRRDKVVATLIPVLCFGFLLLGSFAAFISYTYGPEEVEVIEHKIIEEDSPVERE